jgi:hypothetical protein
MTLRLSPYETLIRRYLEEVCYHCDGPLRPWPLLELGRNVRPEVREDFRRRLGGLPTVPPLSVFAGHDADYEAKRCSQCGCPIVVHKRGEQAFLGDPSRAIFFRAPMSRGDPKR